MQKYYRFNINLPFALYMIFVLAMYLFVMATLPLSLNPMAGKDDGLYISLGRAIAEGHWLGDYTAESHVKGAGYPIFLAINHWTGLSISVGHAIFHIAATLVFVCAIFRISRSVMLVVITFSAILLNPVMYTADLSRILRDNIYAYQSLLIVGLIILAMYAKCQTTRLLIALAGGAVLGWFWITREEGVWIIPGLLILLFVIPARWSDRTKVVLMVVIGASFVYGSVGLANRVVYGSWIETELTEGVFPLALKALQRVDVGPTIAQVPVTEEARKQIYRVSPSFAKLANYIERPDIRQIGCQHPPYICGEIAGGWFHWVVRDAAQSVGLFATPFKSKAFFVAIANEVNLACDSGVLYCRPSTFLNIPRIELRELSQIPKLYIHAIRRAIYLDTPELVAPNSVGPESMVSLASTFLNRPNVQPVSQDGASFNNMNSRRAQAYRQLRKVLVESYALILQISIPLGAVSLILLTAMQRRNLPVLAGVVWVLVILASTRILLLTIVEATTFSGATSLFYLGPVSHLIAVAAICSLYIFVVTIKNTLSLSSLQYNNKG